MKHSHSPTVSHRPNTHLNRLTRLGLASVLAAIPAAVMSQNAEEAALDAIADKLDAVTVYYLERENGQRYTVDGGPDRPSVAPVFFYAGSAESLRDDLLSKEPPIETQIAPVGLGEVYMSLQNPVTASESYALIGDPWQVSEARRVNQDGSFNQTPVFAVQQSEEGGFLTMRNADGASVMPLFIESQRALAAVELMVQQNPDLQEELKVTALPLQTAVNDMVNGRLNIESVIFIPPQ